MIPTWVMVAALVTTPNSGPPVARTTPALPVYQVPGPAFQIPCKVTDRTPELVGVQLWVSADGGKTWTFSSEITPDDAMFEYHAKVPGEYLFTPRLKFKDGRLTPELGNLVPMQRVGVAAGYQPIGPTKPMSLATIASELEEELTRVELELIRKEIKRLTEANRFDRKTGEEIDRLRSRLCEVQNRLAGAARDPLPSTSPRATPLVPDDPLIPPPSSSPLPRPSEVPLPPAPVRR